MRTTRWSHWTRHLAVGSLVFVWALPTFAALGGSLDSVEADRARMTANVIVTQERSFSVHELKSSLGVVIREYVSPSGRVFGVAWEGPFIPDMRQLLGAYFSHFSAAAKVQRESHGGRHPLNVQGPGLVVQSNGHMRAYSGRAYDPELLPEGVSGNDVR